MWGTHLKQKGRWWHYYRAVPREFSEVERKALISFSLKTGDFIEARRMAADISAKLEVEWREAKARGVSLCAQDATERYRAAMETQQQAGLAPKLAHDLCDEELLSRLRLLLEGSQSTPEQKALLGLTNRPEFSLGDAFDRFWDYIKDEWMLVSHDQRRVKRNIYLKAIRNFEDALGTLSFHIVDRSHAVRFRSWWVERLKERGLNDYRLMPVGSRMCFSRY